MCSLVSDSLKTASKRKRCDSIAFARSTFVRGSCTTSRSWLGSHVITSKSCRSRSTRSIGRLRTHTRMRLGSFEPQTSPRSVGHGVGSSVRLCDFRYSRILRRKSTDSMPPRPSASRASSARRALAASAFLRRSSRCFCICSTRRTQSDFRPGRGFPPLPGAAGPRAALGEMGRRPGDGWRGGGGGCCCLSAARKPWIWPLICWRCSISSSVASRGVRCISMLAKRVGRPDVTSRPSLGAREIRARHRNNNSRRATWQACGAGAAIHARGVARRNR